MEAQDLKLGKARVMECLVAPLAARGMVRARGVSAEAHEAMLASLTARLAHMSEAGLYALAEVVERHAGGKAANVWPAEVSICNWARSIEEPPASDSRLVTSYLRSVAGRRAASEGYAVELFGWLKKHGAPPSGEWALGKIRQEADDNRRARLRIEEASRAGRATPSEEAWLRAWWDRQARVEAIMAGAADAAERAGEGAAA